MTPKEGGVAAEMRMEEGRCRFWMPKKKRFCANTPLHSHTSFCGNHLTRSDAKWVPCPIDPSHRVLEDNVDGHLKRCPLFKQAQNLSAQPYYSKSINADPKLDEPDVSSEMKRKFVHSLSLPQFSALLSQIHTLHAAISKDIPFSYKVPPACHLWIQRQIDKNIPYQEKHVLQQASILGNLEDVGVLSSTAPALSDEHSDVDPCLVNTETKVSAVVEFGAGRGYLTQILADSYGIHKVFLVERKSYKLKADRSLRQIQNLALERLRIDIEDLDLNAVQSLREVPYLAIGKHLCGPATDLTLRCCLARNHDQDIETQQRVHQHLKGIAVATCCHHICQWKHYTGRIHLMNLGVTKEVFHAITWFTSWAVDADHGSNLLDDEFQQPPLTTSGSNELVEEAENVENLVKNMKVVDRATLGFKCKDIIDMGRLMWLNESGVEARLVKYVPSDISPENRLLVANV